MQLQLDYLINYHFHYSQLSKFTQPDRKLSEQHGVIEIADGVVGLCVSRIKYRLRGWGVVFV